MTAPRRLRNALSAARRATQQSASPTRHPSSIRSLRSLDALAESLTALRRTNDQFTSGVSARMADELARL